MVPRMRALSNVKTDERDPESIASKGRNLPWWEVLTLADKTSFFRGHWMKWAHHQLHTFAQLCTMDVYCTYTAILYQAWKNLPPAIMERCRLLRLGLLVIQHWVVPLVLLWSHFPLLYSPGILARATVPLMIYSGLSKGGIRTQCVSVWCLDWIRYIYRPC